MLVAIVIGQLHLLARGWLGPRPGVVVREVEDVLRFGVDQVEDEYEVLTAQADCALGIMSIDEVPANTYIIDVVARDGEGIIQFNGQEEIEVDRGDVADLEVRLLPVRTDVTE